MSGICAMCNKALKESMSIHVISPYKRMPYILTKLDKLCYQNYVSDEYSKKPCPPLELSRTGL